MRSNELNLCSIYDNILTVMLRCSHTASGFDSKTNLYKIISTSISKTWNHMYLSTNRCCINQNSLPIQIGKKQSCEFLRNFNSTLYLFPFQKLPNSEWESPTTNHWMTHNDVSRSWTQGEPGQKYEHLAHLSFLFLSFLVIF